MYGQLRPCIFSSSADGLHMAAMTCSLPLLLLLIDNGITASPAVDIISVDSGGAVRLCSDLSVAEQKLLHDLRWKHANLLLVLKDNVTKCHNGRCTLLPDGSLSYDRAEARDSGEYSMQAFDKDGKRFKTKEIFLRVDSSKSSSKAGHHLCCCPGKTAAAAVCFYRRWQREKPRCYRFHHNRLLPPVRFHSDRLHHQEEVDKAEQDCR